MIERNNRIPVYLSDEEKRNYTKLAQANNRSLTALVRKLLADAFSKFEADQTSDQPAAITAVELVFENVESYAVPMKFIESFNLGGLHRSLEARNLSNAAQVAPDYSLGADSLSLSLDPYALDTMKADRYAVVGDPESLDRTLLQRILQFNDIAAVDILYADGSHQYVNLYWGRFGDSTNTAMRCSKDFDGNLAISINADNDYDPFANAKLKWQVEAVYDKRNQQVEKLYQSLVPAPAVMESADLDSKAMKPENTDLDVMESEDMKPKTMKFEDMDPEDFERETKRS